MKRKAEQEGEIKRRDERKIGQSVRQKGDRKEGEKRERGTDNREASMTCCRRNIIFMTLLKS